MPKSDNFLVDAIGPKAKVKPPTGLSYVDGFRFGFGFFIAGLLIAVILGALATALVFAFHLH
jgi:hypothetical protein